MIAAVLLHSRMPSWRKHGKVYLLSYADVLVSVMRVLRQLSWQSLAQHTNPA